MVIKGNKIHQIQVHTFSNQKIHFTSNNHWLGWEGVYRYHQPLDVIHDFEHLTNSQKLVKSKFVHIYVKTLNQIDNK